MPQQPKIAVLASYRIYPAQMGGQKGIACFYQYFSELIDTTLLSTSDNEYPSDTRCRYISVFSSHKSRYINPFLFFRLRNIIRTHHITHLIIEHPYMGWLGLLCQWLLGVKLIVHSHNIEGLRFQSMGKWWWKILWNYERFVHRHARFSFFITDEDRQYAFEKFGLPKSSSTTITYGIEQQSGPSAASKLAARNRLLEKHGLPPDCRLMLFNGTLSYQPNFDAVQSIVMQINPILAKEAPGPYCIFICGKELPVTKLQLPPQVVYTGFVDDIQTYYLGSDLFLNPVLDGGGIKTKLVESLSAHTMAVSYENGAIGVPKAIAGDALTIIQNQDYVSFAQAIVHLWNHKKETPAVYFEHFYWGNIARKAQQALNQV